MTKITYKNQLLFYTIKIRKKKILRIIASEKYLRINLIKEVTDTYKENLDIDERN